MKAVSSAIGLVSVLLVTLIGAAAAQRDETRRPPVPVDPVSLILEALKTHAVVSFSDSHGYPELAAFEQSVIRDARIRAAINDVVIENGNARFQPVMDRYVGGEQVSYEELRHVWHDTTQIQTIGPRDGTIPALARAVRELNAGAPRERRIRILLGDPPIDWTTVRTAADHRRWIEQRDIHAAGVIEREVLAKHRHALVIYGQGHLQRKQLAANYSTEGLAATVASEIEKAAPGQLFSLWWLTDRKAPPADVGNWPVPSAALVRGTTFGAMDFTEFEEAPRQRAAIVDGRIVPLPPEQWKSLRMEEQFDAVLNLGRSHGRSAEAGPAVGVCADKEWLNEWLRRLAMGPPIPTAAQLRQLCVLTP